MAELSTRYNEQEGSLRQYQGQLASVESQLANLSQLGLDKAGNADYDSLILQQGQLNGNISGCKKAST